MNKDELLAKLRVLAESDDCEQAHCDADGLLIQYINDPEIESAYDAIGKWYA